MLEAFGLRLRPSRGQHFLVSRRVLDRILAAAEPGTQDTILEVGAGIGTLTVALARTGARVMAVEVDARLIPALRAACASYPRVRLIHADAMRLVASGLPEATTKVVANLPYSIASPLLIEMLEVGVARRYVAMVQEEVARRIAAAPGSREYGLLSVAVQSRARPVIVAAVPRSAFYPSPRVVSCIVRLDVPDDAPIPATLAPAVMAVARAAFGQRRKMLRTALRTIEGWKPTPEDVEALCLAAGIDPRRRGEDLSLDEFARLAFALGDRHRASGAGRQVERPATGKSNKG
jgi:16S rRNA (adenine1518-N6/adenine1519-N6)-dimethyltransferase